MEDDEDETSGEETVDVKIDDVSRRGVVTILVLTIGSERTKRVIYTGKRSDEGGSRKRKGKSIRGEDGRSW